MGNRWQEIRTIFTEELRRGTSRIWYRISTLAVPAILVILIVAVPVIREVLSEDEDAGESVEQPRTGIVDLSGLVSAGEVATNADIRLIDDRKAGVAALVEGDISALFVVTEDYLQTGNVEWLHTSLGVAVAIGGEGAAENVRRLLLETLVQGRFSQEVETRFLRPANFESLVVSKEGDVSPGAEAASFLSVSYIFGLLLMVGIFTGSGYLLQSVSDEKETRMIEVLLTSASPMGVMAGKVLAMGTLGLFQVMVWALSLALLGPRILSSVPEFGQLTVEPVLVLWTIAFFLAGYFVLSTVMAGIGAATTSYREGSQISVLVILPGTTPFILWQVIVGDPGGGLARSLSFFPITAPMTMMLRMGATEIPLWEIIASLAVTVTGGIGLLWLSARVFRAGLLLYGQRMSLRRILGALRQAA